MGIPSKNILGMEIMNNNKWRNAGETNKMKYSTPLLAFLFVLLVAVGGAHATTVYSNATDQVGLCSSSQDSYYPAGGTTACQDYGTLTITTTENNQNVQFDARTWLRRVSGGSFNGLWRIRDVTNSAVVGVEQTILNPTSPGVNGTYSTNITVATPGTYTYRLQYHTVGTFNAMALDGFNLTITAYTAPPPVADFTGTPTSGYHPLTVAFTDTSSGTPTSWAWDFQNDGSTDSTLQNPSFQYADDGVYTVKLTANNTAGGDVETKTSYITVTTNPSVSAPALGGGGRQVTAATTISPVVTPVTTTTTTASSGSTTSNSEPTLFSSIVNWFKGLFK